MKKSACKKVMRIVCTKKLVHSDECDFYDPEKLPIFPWCKNKSGAVSQWGGE
jgi:hypothetical protein